MRVKSVLRTTVAAAAVMVAGAAFGGVTLTKHDMDAMAKTVTGVADRGVCSYCHVPHGAKGDRLWAGTPATTYTPVANLCSTCHNSASVTEATAESRNMFLTGAHGFDETVIEAANRYGQGTSLATSGLPYANDDAGVSGTDIDCTSCHDPHTNTAARRPFIRLAVVGSLCEACHGGRTNTGVMAANTNGATTPYSQHPVGAAYDGRTTAPITWTQVYGVPADLAGASNATEGKWYLGGHKSDGTNFSSGTGGVVCITCHIVHGDDPDATYSGANVLPYTDLLVNEKQDSTDTGTADLCTDCHTANPGAASTAAHPIGGDATFQGTVTGNNLVIDAAGLGNDATAPSSVSFQAGGGVGCLSCHDTHFGENNTPILADTGLAMNAWCGGCHTGTIITNRVHHPATGAANTTWDNASWTSVASTTTGFYSATLACSTCHRAHNAEDQGLAGAEFILRAANWDSATAGTPTSEMCVACHSANPGRFKYNLTGQTHFGSHWVSQAGALTGDNAVPTNLAAQDTTTLPGIQTNRTGTPGAYAGVPVRRTNWPDTGLDYAGSGNTNSFSKMGGETFSFTTGPGTGDTTAGVLCESCHSVTNPREADWLLLGEFDLTARNTSDNTTDITAVAHTAQGGDGLCLGCHGIPNGTHPTTASVVTKTGAALSTTSAYASATPSGEAFYPGSNQMTCTSCHDTHSGNTGAAAYILKQGNAGTTQGAAATLTNAVRGYTGSTTYDPAVDFTDLCAACHSTYQ